MISDTEKVARIRKWAEGLVNCTHQLCSLAESSWEEKFGQDALDILNDKLRTGKTKRMSKEKEKKARIIKLFREPDGGRWGFRVYVHDPKAFAGMGLLDCPLTAGVMYPTRRAVKTVVQEEAYVDNWDIVGWIQD